MIALRFLFESLSLTAQIILTHESEPDVDMVTTIPNL
jgi:hypothetical protein